MGGAGVYQLSLWAHLGTRRGQFFSVLGAGRGVLPHWIKMQGLNRVTSDVWQEMGGDVVALGGNDGRTLARFALAYMPPPAPLYMTLPVNPGGMSLRQMQVRWRQLVSDLVLRLATPVGHELPDRSAMRRILIDAFSEQPAGNECSQLPKALPREFQDLINEIINAHAGQLKERTQRRAFRWAACKVLRLLRRMIPHRAPQRPPTRAPRPLYSRAKPPVAPLAPPAL